MSPYVDAIFTLEVNDPAFMAMVATTMPSGVQLYIDSNFCTHSCGPRRVVHRRVVHPCDTGGAAKTLDETSTCRRKVDAAENRDTRREEEALVTAVAMTYN